MVTVEEPAFKLVQAGESVKLSCDGRSAATATTAGSSQGPLTITWSSDTGRYAQSTGGVWELSNLEVEDSGTYTCTVTDGVHTSSISIVVRVEGSKPIP